MSPHQMPFWAIVLVSFLVCDSSCWTHMPGSPGRPLWGPVHRSLKPPFLSSVLKSPIASPQTCPANINTNCGDSSSDEWEGEFFPGISKIKYEDWLRFSVAFWHTFRGTGADPFGVPTKSWPWEDGTNSVAMAKRRMRANFEFINKLGVERWCFHDRDIAPDGKTLTVCDFHHAYVMYLCYGFRPVKRELLPLPSMAIFVMSYNEI
ncbi:Xylose isomerase [Platanthera zijinensis]|uniref:xylose isomerase n=1 Tax=Platanthera zijinensis TaxID=2320716 RepID=A0AAP0BNZ6_9ASPA